jgi:hypothetical protein
MNGEGAYRLSLGSYLHESRNLNAACFVVARTTGWNDETEMNGN